MAKNSTNVQAPITLWHRNLLTAAAILTILLIAMGGVLCVTQSIRDCPDWPGCFGRIVPPPETGPILEYTHRLLAAVSGLLILSAAIAGLARAPRQRWITIPPLAAGVLLVEVSFFGALVVLRGLAPGWAAVDVGSALLAVALMIAAAVVAHARSRNLALPDRLTFRSPFARLVLATTSVVYAMLVSGILVAGKNPITGCLGWPIYSPQLFQVDEHVAGNILRLGLSFAGIVMIVGVLVQAWHMKRDRSDIFRLARWVGVAFLIEALVQALLLAFGFLVSLLVVYTVTMSAFWALLVTLLVRTGVNENAT